MKMILFLKIDKPTPEEIGQPSIRFADIVGNVSKNLFKW